MRWVSIIRSREKGMNLKMIFRFRTQLIAWSQRMNIQFENEIKYSAESKPDIKNNCSFYCHPELGSGSHKQTGWDAVLRRSSVTSAAWQDRVWSSNKTSSLQ